MKKLKSESGQVEIIEASLIFPLLILLLILILLKTLNISLKAKSIYQSSLNLINKGNYFEFAGKGYLENGKYNINPYRYIFFSPEYNKSGDVDDNDLGKKSLSSNKEEKKFGLFNYQLIEKIEYRNKYYDKLEKEDLYILQNIIDIDEFIRMCDLSNILMENLLGDKIDEVKERIKKFTNFKSQQWLN